jgi:anti-sigma factor RsiW
MNDTIEQLLPWYVNGTLPRDQREAVERYLAAHPETREEAALLIKAAQTLRADQMRVPETIGLDRTLERVRADKARVSAAEQSASLAVGRARKTETANASIGFFDTLREWLGRSWAQPALVAALSVVGVQSALLFNRSNDETMIMRGSATVAVDAALIGRTFVRVAFKPTATEGEIRIVLSGARSSFFSGPNEQGEYVLSVANEAAARGVEILKNSNIVASVQPIDAPTSR